MRGKAAKLLRKSAKNKKEYKEMKRDWDSGISWIEKTKFRKYFENKQKESV